MADVFSRRERSRIMARVLDRGNESTERRFLLLLRAARIGGWRRHLPLRGKPDFVFPAFRVAIFLDGCFWHGCPRHLRLPADNRAYWVAKVGRNRRRDRRTTLALRARGWRVVRIWEHALKDAAGRERSLARVKRMLSASAPR
jgi:DNA mismatch endonuclease (patch repair protein)